MDNLNKGTYNDNFSDFLNEYKSKSESKKQWVTDNLIIIDKAIESIQNEAADPLKTELNAPRQIIKNTGLDAIEKVIFSIKDLNDIFNKERIPGDLLLRMSAFKRIVNMYINIAKYTSDEIIARETINLGKTLEKQLSNPA